MDMELNTVLSRREVVGTWGRVTCFRQFYGLDSQQRENNKPLHLYRPGIVGKYLLRDIK